MEFGAWIAVSARLRIHSISDRLDRHKMRIAAISFAAAGIVSIVCCGGEIESGVGPQSSCLTTCTGSYVCSSNPAFTSTGPVGLVLDVSAPDGCVVGEDGGALIVLVCGGQFVEELPDGTRVMLGQWSGDNSGFSVVKEAKGGVKTVKCTPTNQSPDAANVDAG